MAREPNGRFSKGNSAAKGKRGYKDRGRQLARLFTDEDIQLLYRTLKSNIERGDIASLNLVSRYVAPPPKQTMAPVEFDLDSGDVVSAAMSIMEAVSRGELAPDVGRTLIEGLGTVQRIKEVVEIEQRVVELEEQIGALE